MRMVGNPQQERTTKSFTEEMAAVALVAVPLVLGVWLIVEVFLNRDQKTGFQNQAVLASLVLVAQPVLGMIRRGEHKDAVDKHVSPAVPILLMLLAIWLVLSAIHGAAPDRMTGVAVAASFLLFVLGYWLINDRT